MATSREQISLTRHVSTCCPCAASAWMTSRSLTVPVTWIPSGEIAAAPMRWSARHRHEVIDLQLRLDSDHSVGEMKADRVLPLARANVMGEERGRKGRDCQRALWKKAEADAGYRARADERQARYERHFGVKR